MSLAFLQAISDFLSAGRSEKESPFPEFQPFHLPNQDLSFLYHVLFLPGINPTPSYPLSLPGRTHSPLVSLQILRHKKSLVNNCQCFSFSLLETPTSKVPGPKPKGPVTETEPPREFFCPPPFELFLAPPPHFSRYCVK